jgi:hypothetical protein
MSDDARPQPTPQLRFDNGNNSSISLHVLAEHARTGAVRVFERGFDSTGKMILAVELPGSSTVRPRERPRR